MHVSTILHIGQMFGLLILIVLNVLSTKAEGKRLFLRILLVSLCLFIAVSWYFQRFSIMSDIYYHTGSLKASQEAASRGLEYLSSEPDYKRFLYGKEVLKEKQRRANAALDSPSNRM